MPTHKSIYTWIQGDHKGHVGHYRYEIMDHVSNYLFVIVLFIRGDVFVCMGLMCYSATVGDMSCNGESPGWVW